MSYSVKFPSMMKIGVFLAVINIFCIVSACNPFYGFIESEFELAPESRLPKWFKISTEYARKELTMKLTYYTHPSFMKVKMVLRGPLPKQKVIMTKVGVRRVHPYTERQLQDQKKNDMYPILYPNYEIITVDDIEEVFEQRRPETILYVSDDPKLTSLLKRQ